MNKLISFIEYIVAFLIILECGTMYSQLLPVLKSGLALAVSIILLVITVLIKSIKYINFGNIFFFILCYFLYSSVILLYSEEEKFISYICRFLIIIPTLSIYFSTTLSANRNRFSLFYKFSEIMICLSIVSIIIWALLCMGKIQSTGYVPHSWGESMKTYSRFVSHFYFIHFEIQNIDLFNLSNIYRNTGIFAEGPMFNICLCVSLMIELFLKDVIKKWRIVILTVTIITVFSTTGFIFLFLSFFCFLFLNNRKKGITKRVWKNGLFLIVAFCAYFFIELIANEKKESYSYQERNEHIELGIKMWEASPFFGNGYFATADRVVSNGIWRILADGGIYFFLLYTTAFLFIPYWYYIKYKRRGFLFVFLLMFFLLYPTIVSYRGVTLMFIALAFSVFLQKAHNRNYIVYRN